MSKIFIDNIDTYIGQSLLEEFLNQETVPQIFATLSQSHSSDTYPSVNIISVTTN